MNRLVATTNGFMVVSDRDQYVGRSLIAYGQFSSQETSFFRSVVKKGSTAVDVGANIGAHTIAMSRAVGRGGTVHAFEPQRHAFQMLCGNMALNNCMNVFCHQAAVGEHPAEIAIRCPDPNVDHNFGGLSLEWLKGGDEVVQIKTLADIPAQFIKIDVEGMEAAVIRGASAMIAYCKPDLYVENDRPEKSAELIDLIRSLGYVPRWHITPLFEPENFNANPSNIWGRNIVSFNMFCVHESKEQIDTLPVADCSSDELIKRGVL